MVARAPSSLCPLLVFAVVLPLLTGMVVRAGSAREGFLSCASVQENGDTGRVFVYGTLQSLPVVRALLQREPRRRRALLFGAYEGPFRVRGVPYPGVLAPDALPVEPRDRAQSSTSLGVGQVEATSTTQPQTQPQPPRTTSGSTTPTSPLLAGLVGALDCCVSRNKRAVDEYDADAGVDVRVSRCAPSCGRNGTPAPWSSYDLQRGRPGLFIASAGAEEAEEPLTALALPRKGATNKARRHRDIGHASSVEDPFLLQDAPGPASATADPGASSSASQHFISGWVLEGLSVEELELLDFFEDDDEYERVQLPVARDEQDEENENKPESDPAEAGGSTGTTLTSGPVYMYAFRRDKVAALEREQPRWRLEDFEADKTGHWTYVADAAYWRGEFFREREEKQAGMPSNSSSSTTSRGSESKAS